MNDLRSAVLSLGGLATLAYLADVLLIAIVVHSVFAVMLVLLVAFGRLTAQEAVRLAGALALGKWLWSRVRTSGAPKSEPSERDRAAERDRDNGHRPPIP